MKRQGIVLAAGLATRMPNKALLPLHDGRPAIFSGIRYLQRSLVESITVVYRDEAVRNVVASHGPKGIQFIRDRSAQGPIASLRLALVAGVDALVVMCDNVYPAHEKAPMLDGSWVVVRNVEDSSKQNLLKTESGLSLTTPWLIHHDDFLALEGIESTAEMLKAIEFLEIERHQDGWRDIGTPYSFERYWDAHYRENL